MVFCRGCGWKVHESAEKCPNCGAVQIPLLSPADSKSGTLWLAVPSLITGILSLITLADSSEWDVDTYLGVLTFIVIATVLGVFGAVTQTRGRGMSIAGIILALLALLGVIGRILR